MKTRTLVIVMVLLMSTTITSASDGKWKGIWSDESPHSISISVGSLPTLPGYYGSQAWGYTEMVDYSPEVSDYDYYKSKVSSSPVLSLSYFYRPAKWFSVGCSVGYGYELTQYNGYYDDQHAFSSCNNVILFTPMVRLHWLNTKHIEIYSGLGILSYGVSITNNANMRPGDREIVEGLAMQFTPIGLSAKFNRTYIFSEVGVGALGAFRFGVGYKF